MNARPTRPRTRARLFAALVLAGTVLLAACTQGAAPEEPGWTDQGYVVLDKEAIGGRHFLTVLVYGEEHRVQVYSDFCYDAPIGLPLPIDCRCWAGWTACGIHWAY